MRRNKIYILSLTILAFVLVMSGCSAKALKNRNKHSENNSMPQNKP